MICTRQKKKNIVFFDINSFAHEEFTSGLFISIKLMLKGFIKKNCNAYILSIAEENSSKKNKIKRNKNFYSIEGIKIKKYFFKKKLDTDKQKLLLFAKLLLEKHKPKIVIVNTPAVFFNNYYTSIFKIINNCGAKVIVLVLDELFPVYQNNDKEDIRKYYQEVNKGEVYAISERIIRKLEKVKVRAKIFPQIFEIEKIIADTRRPQYITMINQHPIKGIEIFNEIAKRMPNEKFLSVKSWPDVPDFKTKAENIKIKEFNKNIKDIYKRTKILLVPSLCQEGIARVVIEAMLNEIPVIANRIGSLMEINKDDIYFVESPKRINYRMKKTVLFPSINKNEKDRMVNDYIKIINQIEKNKKEKYLILREKALKIVEKNKIKFDQLLNSLLK
jgi:glycosyltransferase involved in cell wall biosynthesis